MPLSQDEQDLARWLYLVAGFSRARLARDFECSVAEIEQAVGTGLAETMKSSSSTRKPHKSAFGADSPQPQTETQFDWQLARAVLARVLRGFNTERSKTRQK